MSTRIPLQKSASVISFFGFPTEKAVVLCFHRWHCRGVISREQMTFSSLRVLGVMNRPGTKKFGFDTAGCKLHRENA